MGARLLLPALLTVLALGGLPARGGDAAGRPGEIELSDGSVVRGLVRFTEGRTLKLQEGGKSRTELLEPADVLEIEMHATEERMERPFRFETPGDPTKTYGEGTYPLRNLAAKVRLRDGRTLEGALLSTPVYVLPEGSSEEVRYALLRQQKGKVGQTLEGLVYVKAVRFLAEGEAPAPASLKGRLQSDDRLEDVACFHEESGRIVRGRVLDPKAGTFVVTGLPAGTVDVVLQSEDRFWHGFPDLPAERPTAEGAQAGSGLLAADREAVEKATGLAGDFFEERQVLALAGTHEKAFALVLLDRRGKTSYESELQGQKLWRMDLWLWHRLEKEWQLDRRLFLFRGRTAPDEAVRKVVFLAALGGRHVAAGEALDLGDLALPGANR